jgi:hypothetical protein
MVQQTAAQAEQRPDRGRSATEPGNAREFEHRSCLSLVPQLLTAYTLLLRVPIYPDSRA